mmetsp:Transcript_56149/g.123264  ORF Transcript_56149/g.123264 Transcript_56149/m.123264 type:complete len:262 (+) Transcript_56149:238-1023(+)
MRFSRRRRKASSKSQGAFEVASTSKCPGWPAAVSGLVSLRRPSMWIKNSDLKRRDASCSMFEPRCERRESISSKKRMEGTRALAVAKRARNNFSDSPRHFEVSVAELQLKKVTFSVQEATAFANIVFPVPGGPKSKTPFQGVRSPVKNSGSSNGSITASLIARLASSRPPMSSNFTLRFATTMSRSMATASSICSPAKEAPPPGPGDAGGAIAPPPGPAWKLPARVVRGPPTGAGPVEGTICNEASSGGGGGAAPMRKRRM